jgi:hypothetical protein
MISELDTGKSWFLERLNYSDVLTLIVVEGFASDESTNVPGTELKASRLLPTEGSRVFEISFSQFVTWQVVDESFSVFDKSEVKEDAGNFIQTISAARYFDYVEAAHGHYELTIGKAKMYRIWTENEVIEVVACEPPSVAKVTPNFSSSGRRAGAAKH